MQLFTNVLVSQPECIVIKEEGEPFEHIARMTSHLIVDTGHFYFFKFNFAHKICQLHLGSLLKSSPFPLCKKERLVFANSIIPDDYN